MSTPNNQGNSQQSAAEREQKMLDSSMENLSQRLTDLRGSISQMIAKVENDPHLNWPSFLNSLALISGQMNSLMKNIKSEATNKNPPLLYRRYITLPLFLSPDRDEELVKLTEGRVTTFRYHSYITEYF
jgi:mediator of RNA polymerase II transcription subunit 8